MTSARRSSLLWLTLTGLSACLLWMIVWRAFPPYPNGRFDIAHSYSARWPNLPPFNLPGVDHPAFYDLQVLIWGVDVAAHGGDPYHEPSPAGTPYFYNYPRIWFQLAAFGLTLEDTRPVGLGIIAAFFACTVVVTRPRTALGFFWVFAILLSPPSLEAISYVNNDLIIFVLLSLTALCWAARRPAGGWPALGLLALAAMLKIYPACALLAVLDGRRRALVAASAVGAGLVVFFAAHLDELRTVSSQTPRPHSRAIGSQVLSSRLLDGATRHPATLARLESTGGLARWHRLLPLATSAALLGLLVAGTWLGQRHARRQQVVSTSSEIAAATDLGEIAFRLGACVYLATFAIGHNYMHREILLLLVGPYLLSSPSRRWLALLILFVVWLAAMPTGPAFYAVQSASWVLAGGLAYWLTRSLVPDLLRTFRTPALSATASHA